MLQARNTINEGPDETGEPLIMVELAMSAAHVADLIADEQFGNALEEAELLEARLAMLALQMLGRPGPQELTLFKTRAPVVADARDFQTPHPIRKKVMPV
jgi:hypothetical protein